MEEFGYLIFAVAILGFFINGFSLGFLLYHQRSIFHRLLLLLAFYDILVVISCGIVYGLPDIWTSYYFNSHPYVSQFALPFVHIAVMSSVYSTVLLSFERYIRICFFCQLRTSSLITKENLKYYIAAVIFGPILFYLPKFFEVRPLEVSEATIWSQVDCKQAQVLLKLQNFTDLNNMVMGNFSGKENEYFDAIIRACENTTSLILSGGDDVQATTSTLRNLTRKSMALTVSIDTFGGYY